MISDVSVAPRAAHLFRKTIIMKRTIALLAAITLGAMFTAVHAEYSVADSALSHCTYARACVPGGSVSKQDCPALGGPLFEEIHS